MKVDLAIPMTGEFAVETPDGAVLRGRVDGLGRSLLLVSGLGGSAAFWSHNIPLLARHFRVICFDQRGIAASTRGSAPCTIAQLALDCETVLDATGTGGAVVLGHSTGGCIGQALAEQAAEKVAGLILSATWHRPSLYMSNLFGMRRNILAADAKAYAAIGALMAYPPVWLEQNWRVFESAVAAAPTTDTARLVVQERIDALLAFNSSSYLGLLEVPAFVVGAQDDIIVPSFLQDALSEMLTNCRRTTLATGGHFFPVVEPQHFADLVIDWIDDLQ
jgi:aminoacrylate hydrolase